GRARSADRRACSDPDPGGCAQPDLPADEARETRPPPRRVRRRHRGLIGGYRGPPSQIVYLNTDLDLVSEPDLTPLWMAMDARGVRALLAGWQQGDDRRVLPHDRGCWHLTLEHAQDLGEPERAISAMLDVIESLPGEAHDLWTHCTLREFDIGYDCGAEPWA